MRLLFVAAAMLAFSSTAEAVTYHFTTPGWYQISDSIVGPIIWSDPFPDEASCEAKLPLDDEDSLYSCNYLEVRPRWDPIDESE